jgi:hypothetical protein
MPLPKPKNKENKSNFVSRCVSELSESKEFESQDQRLAVCYKQFEEAKGQALARVTFENEEFLVFGDAFCEECEEDLGFNQELTAENFYLPENSEYVSSEEVSFEEGEVVELDVADLLKDNSAIASEYQGRKVKLNKPFRTSGGPKKFAVYVKNKSGKVIIVRFGDPNMSIKKNIPARRKSFRARHKCDQAKDKTTPRYWACKSW